MEEMKKKEAAASSFTLDRDVALESFTSSLSANDDTEDDFKFPTPAMSSRRQLPQESKLTSELTLAFNGNKLSIRAATSPTPLLQ